LFNKIETKKVYKKIIEQIIELIQHGDLKPGDKLPSENILTKEFDISRPSVREALSAMEVMGIIESKGGKGNFIKDNIDFFMSKHSLNELNEKESPFELLEVKKIIEPGCAGLCALHATKEDIIIMKKSLEKIHKSNGNIDLMIKYDREFHLNIAKATHNNLIFSFIQYLYNKSKEKKWNKLKQKRWRIPGSPEKYHMHHKKILDAIRRKNYQEASENMFNHINIVEKEIIDLFM